MRQVRFRGLQPLCLEPRIKRSLTSHRSFFTAAFNTFRRKECKIVSMHVRGLLSCLALDLVSLSPPAQCGPIAGEAEIDVPSLPSGGRNEYSNICALWRPQVEARMLLRRLRTAAHSGGSLSPGHLETPCSGHCLVPPEVPAEAAPKECQLPDLSASHSLHQLHTHSNPGPVGCFHSLKKRP